MKASSILMVLFLILSLVATAPDFAGGKPTTEAAKKSQVEETVKKITGVEKYESEGVRGKSSVNDQTKVFLPAQKTEVPALHVTVPGSLAGAETSGEEVIYTGYQEYKVPSLKLPFSSGYAGVTFRFGN